jgi:hypothetical protein
VRGYRIGCQRCGFENCSCRRPAGRPLTLPGFCGRRIRNRLGLLFSGLDRLRPKFGRVGIEAENELALAFRDERCKTVAKGLR